ncbi:MAG: type II toxin-antitoxin system VapC family toxin [Aeromicrobium sp.]|uniref:type II toxin-antitoxin system VapC family toxin n=1 Tax=Aeromicrobium sp. TaxID=1871063 RepID=UPI0039E24509
MADLVVDAGVMAAALWADRGVGSMARERLNGQQIHVPELLDLEVASVLRRHVRHGLVTQERADRAIADLTTLRMRRYGHSALLPTIWSLRDNITAYDAAYVALAMKLETVLLTVDARLATAAERHGRVELLAE